MTDKITVRALRPFDNGDELKDESSKPFEVSRQRFDELKANGLVAADGDDAAGAASDETAVLTQASSRVAAAVEAADKEIAGHEARVTEARNVADREVAAHEARIAAAKTKADDAIAAEERRMTEIAQKQSRATEAGNAEGNGKAAEDPANKQAQAPANKAAAKPQVK